jgi:general secretion pathway protein F
MQPALILVVGLMVLYIVLAIMLPILSMSQLLA